MAAYPKPSGNTGTFNNQSFSNTGNTGGLTVEEGLKYFVSYPTTQSPSTITANNFTTTGALNVAGTSQFGGDATFIGGATITGPLTFADNVEVQGTTTLDDTLLCLTTVTVDGILTAETGIDISISGGITFPDNTTQTTAYDDTNAVQNNQNNTFLSPYIQTFQGSNSTTSPTGPLQISNVSTSEYVSFYVDPSPTYDLTLYTAQTGNTAGLTVRNPSYSFSVNPTVGNVATFVNPITSTYAISGQSFGVNTTGSDAYSIYSNTTPSNYGLVIANTTGGNGSLTLSNNGGTLTTLTSTSTGLNIADSLSVDGTLTLGSSGVNATINTASANGITTLSNNNVSGGFTFNVNGGPISTICNMLGTGFYIYNTLDMGDNNIVGLNKLGVTSGQTLSIVDGVTDLMTLSASLGINMFESIGMNNNNISGIGALSGTGNITCNSPLIMGSGQGVDLNGNNMIGCASITRSTGYYVTTNTPPTGDDSGNIATTSFVTSAITAVAPVYTQSTLSMDSFYSQYYSMPSITVNSTYNPSNNVVTFSNNKFVITINSSPFALIFYLDFNTAPFPSYPSPAAQSLSLFCSNGVTYTASIGFQTASGGGATMQIICSAPTTVGLTFTANLSTLGQFTA